MTTANTSVLTLLPQARPGPPSARPGVATGALATIGVMSPTPAEHVRSAA